MAPSFGFLESSLPLPEAPDWSTPFRVAVLGDFTGRQNRGKTESVDALRKRKPKKIDRENFDDFLASLGVALTLDVWNQYKLELTFKNLDDFHPDALYKHLDEIDELDDDKKKSKFMSDLLHHPDFKRLEANWLGLDWLLRRIWKAENGVEAVLYDWTQEEFAAALNEEDDLTQSPIYFWLIEKAMQGHEGQPWAVLLGNYTFERNEADAQTLGRMAKIARQSAAPFLAGVAGNVWDKSNVPEDGWEDLRKLPEAPLLGLATPGFLLRAPYGANFRPVDKFSYEEFKTLDDKQHYLWANAALGPAALLGISFTKKSWEFKPGANVDLTNLAMHVYTDDGEQEVSLAQTWLTRPQIEHLTKQGIMALLCVKGQNAMQLFRFLSLGKPGKDQTHIDLLGSWGQKELKGIPRASTKPKLGVSVGMGSDVESPPEVQAARSAAKAPAPKPKNEEPADEPETSAEESGGDDELAAMLAQLEGGAAEPAAESEPASEGMDDELAAMLASLEGGGDEAPATGEAKEEEPAMDDELAAMLASLEGGGDEEPAKEEEDDELAAMLKQLEGGDEEKP